MSSSFPMPPCSAGPKSSSPTSSGPTDKVERRELEVDEIQDGQAVIKSGIDAGERVVTSGYYRLQPGSLVELPDDTEKGGAETASARRRPAAGIANPGGRAEVE